MADGEEEHKKSPDEGNLLEELEEKSSNDQTEVKDPRIRARKYQLELCKKAVDENIIVCLGTGCGKTHIAVLLIYELRHLIETPKKSVCVFLAPTIPLVRQQASVIEESTNFKVGSYYGNCKHMKNHQEWEKEIEEYEVLVMTPQILLHNLLHRLIKMELIALMIFDECHHAQAQSNHPYAQIMKEYKTNGTKRPRIFGMTASPIVGKGGASPDDLPRGINSLENLLEAKVYSVEDTEELERFVASPKLKLYYYGPVGDCSLINNYLRKLEEIKNQCIGTLRRKTDDVKILRNNTKVLQRLQDNLLFCLESLGLWGAVQAVEILLTGDHSELIHTIDTESDLMDNLANQYLSQAASVVDSDLIRDGVAYDSSILEALKDPIFSKKLLVLIQILSSYRIQPDMKCIIFVNRIIVARTLSYLLRNLKCLSFWKCHFLVGFHSGLKNMSRKNMYSIVEKFRSGELNLLVATRVGEEGLDIQSCCLVIRFDLPETVASFIQSRGRARMPQSEYAFLVERENQNELNLINNFLSEEDRMNKEITCRTSGEIFDVLEEATYRVPSTGASIGAGYSVSLLHRYCSRLPHDEFFIPKPEFFYFDEKGGMMCRIILPSNAPVHQVDSPPQYSKEKAKKIACLRACKELHVLGALTDHLLPVQDDELVEELIEPDTCEDESSREELHEMLSPSVLKNPWSNSECSVLLNFYFIKFHPVPNDRLYQNFGLFVKTPLPREAERMELDLHLAHGRVVKTELVPLGTIKCCTNEIIQAENFQELFLKIILDREDFFADLVPLGRNDSSQSKSSTFYLLLPVRTDKEEGSLTVDWKLIRRCLSSPVFEAQKDVLNSGLIPAGNSLRLADGLASTSDITNSLIYTPHNQLFFFIDDILHGIDADSPFTDHSSMNYVDHYAQKFGISILHPKQPLLKAKQLFSLHNLLHNRVQENTEARELEEHFVELPPELCSLKIIGFSKDIGSSLSLLPSLMHHLENLLVAIELKSVFSHSFLEGSEVTAHHVLEAITTEKCMERFSLERLEVLGDAFLKYAVGRHVFLMHEALDEGQLTGKRSNIVNNTHLYKLAIKRNLQVYIRDENFDPWQFFALGRPCAVLCNEKAKLSLHSQQKSGHRENEANSSYVKCTKGHHWLHKKTIADVVEALVGAFIVDSGFKAAIAFLKWIGIQVDFEASQISKLCLASKSYMSLPSYIDTAALEKALGYRFMHKGLLVQAFVHPSYNKHLGGCYQRLEFLGDAVLDYLITSYLFSVYPKLKPGQLTDLRSVTVNNNVFARVAVGRSFHKYLISDSNSLTEAVQKFISSSHMSPSEEDVIEGPKCPKALGDLVESSVGAILLDSGFNLNLVWKIVLSFLDPIMSFSSFQLNPVRELTELCQSRNWEMQFSSSKKGGTFFVDASVTGSNVHSTGHGTNMNRKAAMRITARKILSKLKAQGYRPNKSKSLEKLLKSSKKEEAKLIGYDETPIQGDFHDVIQLENLQIQEGSPASGSHISNTQTANKELADTPPFRQPISTIDAPAKQYCNITEDTSSVFNSKNGGILPMASARSRLFEVCAASHWKAPAFECVKEEGPSHLKLFTFKVIVEIVGTPNTILECCSDPQPKKKDAEEHAAEGALWYLQAQGYGPKKSTSSKLLLKSTGEQELKLTCDDETPTSNGKQEVELINYDEIPTLGDILDAVEPTCSKIQKNSPSYTGPTSNTKTVKKEPANLPPSSRQSLSTIEAPGKHYCEITEGCSSVTYPKNGGIFPMASAKASLFQICTSSFWKAPVFELVKEEGPSHLKLFTVKVIVEIVGTPSTILECFSNPLPKKKAAEEHAAEGALWYLQHQGYLRSKDK